MTREKVDDSLIKCGEGMTSEVIMLDNDRVLKVYKPDFYENAKVEYKKTLLAGKMGITSPKMYDLTHTDKGEPAIVMEHISGIPLDRYIRKHPAKLLFILYKMAKMSAQITQIPYECLDVEESFVLEHLDNKRYVLSRIGNIAQLKNISFDEISKMKCFYESIPDSTSFVHGNYSLNNIIVSDKTKEFRLIDFGGSGFGFWFFDLLDMYSLFYDRFKNKRGSLRSIIKRWLFRFYLWAFLKNLSTKPKIRKSTVRKTLGAMLNINHLIHCTTFRSGTNETLVRQYADEVLACINSLNGACHY